MNGLELQNLLTIFPIITEYIRKSKEVEEKITQLDKEVAELSITKKEVDDFLSTYYPELESVETVTDVIKVLQEMIDR